MGVGDDGLVGNGVEIAVDDAHDRRGAHGDDRVAGIADADADRAGMVVAGPGRDDGSDGDAPAFGEVRLKPAGRVGRVQDRWQPIGIDAGRLAKIGGPFTGAGLHEMGAAGIGRLGRPLAGELEAHVVLGQQNAIGVLDDLGFVLAQPQDLGCRESRVGAAAGAHAYAGHGLGQFLGLDGRAAVVPQDGRPERAILGVDQDRPEHLSRQADAAQLGHQGRVVGVQGVEAGGDAVPP